MSAKLEVGVRYSLWGGEMSAKLYVGNLPFDFSKEELMQLFGEVGQVAKVNLVCDSFDGHFRGYGFVEMAIDQDADKAIQLLEGRHIRGRNLRVASAHSNDSNKVKPLRPPERTP